MFKIINLFDKYTDNRYIFEISEINHSYEFGGTKTILELTVIRYCDGYERGVLQIGTKLHNITLASLASFRKIEDLVPKKVLLKDLV